MHRCCIQHRAAQAEPLHGAYFGAASTSQQLHWWRPCIVQVDLDLAKEPTGARVCRKQAQLTLRADGRWQFLNTGRRCVHVNGIACQQGHVLLLQHLSLLQVSSQRQSLHVYQSEPWKHAC